MTARATHPLLALEPGQRALLLGNEAIVRGALEAGVGVVCGYPGTPSSEIPDTFEALAEQAGVYFEYSTNEKVALEVGAGAAYSGARTLVSMKHVGLNVALEPLMSLAYTGVPSGLVIVTADDPGCHSSQNEQDNRLIARLADLPCLEPCTPAELLRFTRLAFDLSERFQLPVLVRTTTRTSHAKGVVTVGQVRAPQKPGGFKKDFRRYVTMPPISLARHGVLVDTMSAVARALDAPDFLGERLWFEEGAGRVGVISSGVCRNYVYDALRELGMLDEVCHLELAVTHPLPRQRCLEFLKGLDRVLVVEELEPVIEDELKKWCHEERVEVEIRGKGVGEFSRISEYAPDAVLRTLAGFVNRPLRRPALLDSWTGGPLPTRPPALCAGCPHRASYYALKLTAGPEAIFAGDIGCYTLGALPPFEMQDTMLCMGASTACGGGLSHGNPDKKIVAVIGDSTFFHSGIAGLVNALRHGHDYTVAILDNSTTAMTGHQPHPASPESKRGKRVSIEEVVRGLGVDKVEVVDPMDLASITGKARECLDYPGVAVMICREPCPLYERRLPGPAREKAVYRVNQDLCKSCGFKSQGLHCGVETCSSTELWRSGRKIAEVAARGHDPVRMSVPPCGAACPVNICVHGYVSNIAAGDYRAALETIRNRNPLPSICSRVCHQPCEDACYRGDFEGAVKINRLKRFVCDWATEHADEIRPPTVAVRHEEAVAVVGSGPAGLACAHDLAMRGYKVTVFEQMPLPGGLLRYGIPPYRLPAAVIDRDIAWIAELGVEFRCGVMLGEDLSVAELLKDRFSAVFLAPGAGASSTPPALDVAPARGLHQALDFLQAVNHVHKNGDQRGAAILAEVAAARRVVIIGGGNTGIDAARSALRVGAGVGTAPCIVTIIERTSREESTADPEELHAAEEEGVDVFFGVCVTELVTDDGQVTHLHLEPGPLAPQMLAADVVLVATGQTLDRVALAGTGLLIDDNPWLVTRDDRGHTHLPGVFAAGDAVEGPGSVLAVIAAGKRAAHGIDAYLANDGRHVEPLNFHDPAVFADEAPFEPASVMPTAQIEPTRLSPRLAARHFEPPEWTFTEEEARAEAERCLACGACANCNVCIDHFACVAIYRDDAGQVRVNPALCNGCGVCAELCPNNAYERVSLGGRS